MQPKDFLASVVPWDTGGYITIHWPRPGTKVWPGRSCRTLDLALQAIADAPPDADIYFCCSAQAVNSGRRSRANALGMCALWTDSDVNPDNPSKYPTLEAAIADILYFCQLVGIPPPSIMVASGTGLHCYWLSDKTLPVEVWQSYANALKTAAQNSTLKIDAGVTGDAARVLRVPGTLNHKYDPPRQVRLLQPYCNGNKHDFPTVLAPLMEMVPVESKPNKEPIKTAEAFKELDPDENLGVGIEIKDVPPLPLQPILDGCGWLREAHETGGKNFDEPQWNQTTRCAVFLEDGHALAHAFGNQHPDYTPAETEEKWERKNQEHRAKDIGWPLCRTIRDAGSTHCGTCKFWEKIKSPLNLGYATIKDAHRAEVEDDELRLLGGTRPPELRLPEGYAVDQKGRICAITYGKFIKGKGLVQGSLDCVIRSKLSGPCFQCKDGRYGIGFTAATEIGENTEVFLTMLDCGEGSIIKNLSARFVIHDPESKGDAVMKFMVSWLDKLREEDAATHDSGYMGWRYNKDGNRIGFIYGGKIYNEDGSETPLRAGGDDEFRKWYKPTGTREAWFKAAKLLTDRKRPELDIIMAVAFASPLVTFAGTMYGAILSIWGHPGTSKSTAQMIAAAVWGHPKQTRESLNSTPKSVQGRLGRTRNLPAYWDDVQDERHQNSLFETMFVTAEGAEGGRLNTDTSMRVRLEWQTMLVACSNASFVDFLVKKQKSTTAGMRRVFEIMFEKIPNELGLIDPVTASLTFAALEHNFGMVGAEYAKMLAMNHEQIGELVVNIIKKFSKKVQGTPDESYWWGMCGVLLAGAALAKQLGVNFDLPAMERFLVKAFEYNRHIRFTEGTEGGTLDNTTWAITCFINTYISSNTLVVDRMFSHRSIKISDISRPSPPGRPVYIQIARDERTIVLSKRAMREYMEDNNIKPRQVFDGLVKYFKAKETKLTLGAGTTFSQTQEYCFEILNADQFNIFEEVLRAHGPPKISAA